jgi:hypothetical protein
MLKEPAVGSRLELRDQNCVANCVKEGYKCVYIVVRYLHGVGLGLDFAGEESVKGWVAWWDSLGYYVCKCAWCQGLNFSPEVKNLWRMLHYWWRRCRRWGLRESDCVEVGQSGRRCSQETGSRTPNQSGRWSVELVFFKESAYFVGSFWEKHLPSRSASCRPWKPEGAAAYIHCRYKLLYIHVSGHHLPICLHSNQHFRTGIESKFLNLPHPRTFRQHRNSFLTPISLHISVGPSQAASTWTTPQPPHANPRHRQLQALM